MSALLRSMTAEDVGMVARLWASIWQALTHALGEEARHFDEVAFDRMERRYRYLLAVDPGGSHVAVDDGEIVGLGVSHVHGGTFVLANLGVAPSCQDRGLGRQLLDATLEHGAAAARGLICSSPDPRALVRYLRSGFWAAPAMEAVGRAGVASPAPRALRRSAGSPADLALVDEIDRQVRGAARPGDIAVMVDSGAQLYLDDEGAYALATDTEVVTLCATGPALGRRALVALLSGAVTGRCCTARWLTAATPWAFEAAAEARASLKGHGAVMTRGTWPLLQAWLPSGVFG